jgi:hypothetical protein
MIINQPKVYRLDDAYLAKGVPRPRYDDQGRIIVDNAKEFFEKGETTFQAPIRFRASLTSRRGKANQWVEHSKSHKTDYKAKKLANDRYMPPVIGEQVEMFSISEMKGQKTKKHK